MCLKQNFRFFFLRARVAHLDRVHLDLTNFTGVARFTLTLKMPSACR